MDMTDNPLLEDHEKYLLLWNKFQQRSENLNNLIQIVNGVALTAFLTIFSFFRLTSLSIIAGVSVLIF